VVEKPIEVAPVMAAPEPVVETTPAMPTMDSTPAPEPKPAVRRVRSTKPRKPRTTKAKKETKT
jgi:hypothetical protein